MTNPNVTNYATACPNCSGPAVACGKDIKCEKCDNSEINTKGIVKAYLKKNGFDGLVNEDNDCGCEISDLMPCMEAMENCEPGYKGKCDPETCPADGDCDWHISTKKEKGDENAN